MTVSPAAQALAECIHSWWDKVRPSSGDCRVVAPAPTVALGIALHKALTDRGLPSFLVSSGRPGAPQPSEQDRVLRAEAVTSVRDGSFVVVVEPGELSKLQDSIQGSGGGIRSLAIPDEWPWAPADAGFDFFADFFPKWIRASSYPETEAGAAKGVLKLAVQATEPMKGRTNILFDEILGQSFDAARSPCERADGFAMAVGVPSLNAPSIEAPGVPEAGVNDLVTVEEIAAAMEGANAREAVEQNAGKALDELVEADRPVLEEFKEQLHAVLDRLRTAKQRGRGALSLRSSLPDDWLVWRKMTLPVLRRVFVQEETEASISIAARWNCDPAEAHVLPGGQHCISATGPVPSIVVSVERKGGSAFLEAKAGRRRLAELTLEEGQREGVLPIDWEAVEGLSVALTITATADGVPRASTKLFLERTSNEFSDFLLAATATRNLASYKSLRRVDPGDEGEREESIDFDDFTALFAVSRHGSPSITLDGRLVPCELVAHGVSRLSVDVPTVAAMGTQPELMLANLDTVVAAPLAVEHLGGGTCNLEVSLARSLEGKISSSCDKLLRAWLGDFDARPLLGSPNEEQKKRFAIVASSFELAEEPWRPVVLLQDGPTPAQLGTLGMVRVAEDGEQAVASVVSSKADLSQQAVKLIDRYALARSVVIQSITRRHHGKSRAGLPLYAVASFHYEDNDDLEIAACEYLEAFAAIQGSLQSDNLNYPERFLLSYVDCVVCTILDGSERVLRGCALGPWHPLVVAKRMMVGRGLVQLAKRRSDANLKWLCRLSSLLGEMAGFRWFAGLSAHSALPTALFIEASSDPGWLLATPALDVGRNGESYAFEWARGLLGLSSFAGGAAEAKGFKGYLGDYLRAFPSRRSVVVKLGVDVAPWEAARAAREFLTYQGEVTKSGRLLKGGVHILTSGDGGAPEDYPEWESPVVCVYPRGGKGFANRHKVDIVLAQTSSDVGYLVQSADRAKVSSPRGSHAASVLQMPVRSLDETASGVRDSRLSYVTLPEESVAGIGSAFSRAVSAAEQAAGPSRSVGVRTLTPEAGQGDAVWTVLPGDGADPAVLLDWAKTSAESGTPKVLWDYRMAISRTSRTYYVLSEVPQLLVSHLKGINIFSEPSRAGGALMELASIGLALGSETFKSRTRALGVAGLIGAARVSQIIMESICDREADCHFFLLPIDSFSDLLGGDLDVQALDALSDYRRADLIGVVCRIHSERLELGFCAIESKYWGGKFPESRAKAAFEQAARSLARLSTLAQAAKSRDALAERLALARLVEFGLRLRSAKNEFPITKILTSILRGEYRSGVLGKTGCVVVSTETGLDRSDVCDLEQGCWVRLAPAQWPGERGDFEEVSTRLDSVLSAPWRERSRAVKPAHGISSADSDEASAVEATMNASPVPNGAGPKDPTESDFETNEVETGDPAVVGGAQVEGNKVRGDVVEIGGNEAEPPRSPIGLLLGVDEHGKPVQWQAGVNSNHNFMVTGSSGTGKTQLVKSMLWQAREQGLPALVLDFKNDFASDHGFLTKANLEVQYVSFDGLPYNPLIPCPQPDPRTGRPVYQVSQHINGIVGAFQRTYGLGEQQSADLRDSIRAAFDAVGLRSSSIAYELPDEVPDFSVVGEHLRERNRLAYNRLDPLFDLEIFRDKYRGVSFNDLLGRGYVLDLSAIQADHIQNTLAMLLVYSSHRYLNSLPHAETIKQLLVFDEAHRVLKSENIESLVRECRAYGLGVILSSQYPTDFPPDTAANLAAKVLHGNGPDATRVQAIRSMLGMSQEVDSRLNLPIFSAVTLTKPGQVLFTRTVGYPHRLILDALKEGPTVRTELRQLEGLHADRFDQAIQHLDDIGLIILDREFVRLAD